MKTNTPDLQPQFRRALWGFDPNEVTVAVQLLAANYDAVSRELSRTAQQIAALKTRAHEHEQRADAATHAHQQAEEQIERLQEETTRLTAALREWQEQCAAAVARCTEVRQQLERTVQDQELRIAAAVMAAQQLPHGLRAETEQEARQVIERAQLRAKALTSELQARVEEFARDMEGFVVRRKTAEETFQTALTPAGLRGAERSM